METNLFDALATLAAEHRARLGSINEAWKAEPRNQAITLLNIHGLTLNVCTATSDTLQFDTDTDEVKVKRLRLSQNSETFVIRITGTSNRAMRKAIKANLSKALQSTVSIDI